MSERNETGTNAAALRENALYSFKIRFFRSPVRHTHYLRVLQRDASALCPRLLLANGVRTSDIVEHSCLRNWSKIPKDRYCACALRAHSYLNPLQLSWGV